MNKDNQYETQVTTLKLENQRLKTQNTNYTQAIQRLEIENNELKSAIQEMKMADIEKDKKLQEGTILLTKLKLKHDELFKERQELDVKVQQLLVELKDSKKELIEGAKNKNFLENLEKSKESLKTEKDKMKKELFEMKSKNDELKQLQNELISEKKNFIAELDDMKERLLKMEAEKSELQDKLDKKEKYLSSLSNDLNKKDDEVKTLIKMAQELNNENKQNIDEVAKQSIDTVNMFYKNLVNKNSGNSNLSFEKLMEIYKPSLFMEKSQIVQNIKESKISCILADSITKDFTIPDIYLSVKNQSTSIASLPVEVFHNINLKVDLLKSEMFSGYLREMNICEFIENSFNKKIIKILDKNVSKFVDKNTLHKENKKNYFTNQQFMENNTFSPNFKETFQSEGKILNNTAILGGAVTKDFEISGMKDYNTYTNSPNRSTSPYGYLDFFEELGKNYTVSKEKIESLEGQVSNLSQENSILKLTNKEYQEKNAIYEDTINVLNDKIKSINNIFDSKIQNLTKSIQHLINSTKAREKKIRNHLEMKFQMKENSVYKQIQAYNDELNIKQTEIMNIQRECDRYKALIEKNQNNSSRMDKSRYTRKGGDESVVLLQQQEKDASILEIELEKVKNENQLLIDKINLCNSKLDGMVMENKNYENMILDLNNEIEKQKQEKDTLHHELDLLKNDLNCANEKFLIASNNKLKDKLNQSCLSKDKSRSISPDIKKDLNTSDISGKSNKKNKDNEITNKKLEKLDPPRKMSSVAEIINISKMKENSNFDSSRGHTFQHQQINESFNKESYMKKKNENIQLQSEKEKLKDELLMITKEKTLIEEQFKRKRFQGLYLVKEWNFEVTTKNKSFNMSSNMGQMIMLLIDKINDFKEYCNFNTFKEMKKFFVNFQNEIEAMSQRIEEVKNKFTQVETNFSSNSNFDNLDKKTKFSTVKDIITQFSKNIGSIHKSFSKVNKDILYHSTSLKKAFNFLQENIYDSNIVDMIGNNEIIINKEINIAKGSSGIKVGNMLNNSVFEMTVKMMSQFTKIFTQQEMKKLRAAYSNKKIFEVIDIFKLNCEIVKNNTLDGKWEFESNILF